jgi:hypothetical protein
MRVLLDQGTPAPIARHLPSHVVRTAHQQGWATLGNGELLAVAESDGFDVFITTDKNLRYQQNLSARRIAVVVVMHAQWPALEPYADLLAAAIREQSQRMREGEARARLPPKLRPQPCELDDAQCRLAIQRGIERAESRQPMRPIGGARRSEGGEPRRTGPPDRVAIAG